MDIEMKDSGNGKTVAEKDFYMKMKELENELEIL
jgi:hypothetical protein